MALCTQPAPIAKLVATWRVKVVCLQMTALKSTYHKVQDTDTVVAVDNAEEASSCPISYLYSLQQWLNTQSQWVRLDQDHQNNTDISNAIASADKLSLVPPISSGSEASAAAMSQLLQLMKDVHVSDEQLAEAEKSFEEGIMKA